MRDLNMHEIEDVNGGLLPFVGGIVGGVIGNYIFEKMGGAKGIDSFFSGLGDGDGNWEHRQNGKALTRATASARLQ